MDSVRILAMALPSWSSGPAYSKMRTTSSKRIAGKNSETTNGWLVMPLILLHLQYGFEEGSTSERLLLRDPSLERLRETMALRYDLRDRR